MSTITEQRVFRDACRENTGAHFLDSGSAYGRHYEGALIPREAPEVRWSRGVEYPVVNTGVFLDNCLEHEQSVQEEFEHWAEQPENANYNWFEAGRLFMEEKGFELKGRGNPYNKDNDLTQVYVWEVWFKQDSEATDWAYIPRRDRDDYLLVLYVHTGCDVRGGYTRPYFAQSQGEYTLPWHVVAGVYIVEARQNGETIPCATSWQNRTPEQKAISEMNQEGSVGYSAAPWFHFSRKFVTRVFGFTHNQEDETVCALLSNGMVAKLGLDAPSMYI